MPLAAPGARIDTVFRRRHLTAPSSTFNPLTQVTPLHAVWAGDPSWSNPGDGLPVSSWRNQSGGGDPANTLTARPTYRASVASFNNRPAVEFIAALSQSLTFDIADQAQPFKFVAVAKVNATGTLRRFFASGGSSGHAVGVSAASAWSMAFGTLLSGGTHDTNAHVFRGSALNSASSGLWVDESSVISGNVGATSLTRLTIGAADASGTASNFWDGHVAFLGVYSNATSDATLTQLCVDLKAHYGTP